MTPAQGEARGRPTAAAGRRPVQHCERGHREGEPRLSPPPPLTSSASSPPPPPHLLRLLTSSASSPPPPPHLLRPLTSSASSPPPPPHLLRCSRCRPSKAGRASLSGARCCPDLCGAASRASSGCLGSAWPPPQACRPLSPLSPPISPYLPRLATSAGLPAHISPISH